MIYFIFGADFKKTRERTKSLIGDFIRKKPNISFLKFSEDNITECDIPGLLGGQGLFERQILTVFDNLFSSGIFGKNEIKLISQMEKSSNTFIIIENNPDKITTNAIKKIAVQTEEFPKKTTQFKFNIFSLGDALGERDKKRLWVGFYKAREEGVQPEEIHGVFFWQLKSILIAKEAQNQKESALNPFVYGKAKRFSSKFKTEDLKELSSLLVDLYHQSRKGLTELPIALEKFILKI